MMQSESKCGNTGNEGHSDVLDEGGTASRSPVGEGDINISELGAVRVELELSGSSLEALRVAVLNTGDDHPEVSIDAIALIPLLVANGEIGWNRLSHILVLLALVGSNAASVVGLLVELPSVELIGRSKAVHAGIGEIEIFSNEFIIDSPVDLGDTACGLGAINARAIDWEVND